jgi:polar amino acid transport system substrate-binding protein
MVYSFAAAPKLKKINCSPMLNKNNSMYKYYLYVYTALLSLLLSPSLLAGSHSPRLDIIQARGELIVGVKTDYPPWGFYADDGTIIGLEADLAADIAQRLGVQLRLQKVSSSNRINKLEAGAIDLLIATMGDTEKRRRQTGIIEPSYYSSGATILIHKDKQLRSWAELYGRSVCLTKNTYFNRDLIERFLLKPKEFEGTLDSLAALKFGKCNGWIYDDTALAKLLQEERWQEFKAPLKSIMVNPWAIAVQTSELYTSFGQLASQAVMDWHRSGKLLALEKKWGIKNSQFLIAQNTRWTEKDSSGNYKCNRLSDNSFPSGCLSRKSITSVVALKDNFLSQWNIDFPPQYDDYSRTTLLKGIALTLLLSLLAIFGSLFFGALMGIILYRLPKGWSWLVNRINDIFRMTPPLLNLYIIFFGLGGIAAIHYDIQFNAIAVAVIVFSLYAGSSNAALLCQALHAEAKHHSSNDGSGINSLFPSAFQHAYEGINANSVNIVKAVGLASMIAVPELISSSNSIIAEYGSKSEMMTFLLVFYFSIVYCFIFLLNRLQQWITHNVGVEK